MALTVTHTKVTSGTVNTNVEVDLADWNQTHTIAGSIAASEVTGGAALTKTDDTNVTLTLGGTPTTALLAATSITVGWTGTLAASRGGFGTDVSASAGVPLFAAGVPTFTSTTGSGNFVRATSPTLVTPALGTPSSGVLTNCTGVVNSIAGNTGAFTLANGIDNSTNQIQLTAARRTLPTTQVFTSGSGTYTTPANCLWIEVEMVGGGGGGGGSGTSPGNGGAGGATTFGTSLLTANGSAATTSSGVVGGAGGSASGGYLNKTGANGGNGSGLTSTAGGFGANSPFGGAGVGGAPGAGAGIAAVANSGSGGGGGGVNATINGGGGGGAGGYLRAVINSPSASYSYAVGGGGTAGTAGTSGAAGGAGGSGLIVVVEHYGS